LGVQFAHSGVKERYGQKGLLCVSKLVDIGLAKRESEETVVPVEAWYSYLNAEEALAAIRSISRNFNSDDLGGPFARIAILSEGLTEESAKRVRSILDDAFVEIRKIMDNPSSRGDNVVVVSSLMKRVV
jgi:hypothetical protein